MFNINELLIPKNESIINAIKKIDKGARKILFVIDNNNKLFGAVTDGNIRRWIIKTGNINGMITDICSTNPIYLEENYSINLVKKLMISKRIEAIPIINKNRNITNILFWDDIFDEKKKIINKINIPAIIMAGGKGTRLDPFTKILPKALIPVDNKAMIELIMEEYAIYGIHNFFIPINHKGKMIKAYFEDNILAYNIKFLEESKELGTIGALSMLKKVIDTPFFVSNCDIIIKTDYSEIYNFHIKNKNVLTIVASMQHYRIPYGICEIQNEGILNKLNEKPEFNFLVNTGMYLFDNKIINYISDNTYLNFNDLVELLQNDNQKIGVYPVSEKSWIDIGQLEKYKKTLELFNRK